MKFKGYWLVEAKYKLVKEYIVVNRVVKAKNEQKALEKFYKLEQSYFLEKGYIVTKIVPFQINEEKVVENG